MQYGSPGLRGIADVIDWRSVVRLRPIVDHQPFPIASSGRTWAITHAVSTQGVVLVGREDRVRPIVEAAARVQVDRSVLSFEDHAGRGQHFGADSAATEEETKLRDTQHDELVEIGSEFDALLAVLLLRVF